MAKPHPVQKEARMASSFYWPMIPRLPNLVLPSL
jgi:hypothetical protein